MRNERHVHGPADVIAAASGVDIKCLQVHVATCSARVGRLCDQSHGTAHRRSTEQRPLGATKYLDAFEIEDAWINDIGYWRIVNIQARRVCSRYTSDHYLARGGVAIGWTAEGAAAHAK